MSSPKTFRIVIVGGGIAGLAAAIALRGPHRDITLLEQSGLSTEIGATISLQPNATRIMQQSWNLPDLLEQSRGTVDRGFRIYNSEGKMVNEVLLKRKSHYGGDRIMWHRQDLHAYLRNAATSTDGHGPAAVLRTSSRIIRCDCVNGIVTLENEEQIEADLIIGADGIHSTVRTSVLRREAKPQPTGFSAYRMMLSTKTIEREAPQFSGSIRPADPYTSIVMAHTCRLIMGPARGGELYSIVGLVPDDRMNEDPDSAQSWVTEGDPEKMLETFKDFPTWTKEILGRAKGIGLWQLRDLDPLETWIRGRVILIGDAAHAMLPTQGQGASQAIEDAEALGSYFGNIVHRPSEDVVASTLQKVFQCRFHRASLIQKYSREAAKPATEKGSVEVKM
jgi:salicylate hydroxylase